MDTKKLLIKVKRELPNLIFLTGKTSTGKTTLAKHLQQKHGYKIVELDKIVNKFVIKRFSLENHGEVFKSVYGSENHSLWIEAFVGAVVDIIKKTDAKLVIEGALAHNPTLFRIFGNIPFLFVYMHPIDRELYIKMITKRFEQGAKSHTTGLPSDFWKLVYQDDFDNFLETKILNKSLKKSIKDFAQQSIDASKKRLNYFKKEFNEIVEVHF